MAAFPLWLCLIKGHIHPLTTFSQWPSSLVTNFPHRLRSSAAKLTSVTVFPPWPLFPVSRKVSNFPQARLSYLVAQGTNVLKIKGRLWILPYFTLLILQSKSICFGQTAWFQRDLISILSTRSWATAAGNREIITNHMHVSRDSKSNL